MVSDEIRNLQERTDSKLRYAALHLDELGAHGPPDGSDFDFAHAESFLFHLLGARDAFIAELNLYYGANMPLDGLSPGKLRDALKQKGVRCAELARLYELRQADDSWYSLAHELRDYSTHNGLVSRDYYFGLGKDSHHTVKFRNPKTGELIDAHIHDAFGDWLHLMRDLLASLRADAMKTCGIA